MQFPSHLRCIFMCVAHVTSRLVKIRLLLKFYSLDLISVIITCHQEYDTTHEMVIPHRFHRDLIGFHGTRIMAIQSKFNVRAIFPQVQLCSDVVRLCGASGDVSDCCAHLQELVQQLVGSFSFSSHPSFSFYFLYALL